MLPPPSLASYICYPFHLLLLTVIPSRVLSEVRFYYPNGVSYSQLRSILLHEAVCL